MAAMAAMVTLQAELAKMRKASLANTVNDVDKIIDLLVSAREQVAASKSLSSRCFYHDCSARANPIENQHRNHIRQV
jgi:hypothetical protein